MWVVLELTERCEREPPDQVLASLARDLKGAEVFVPSLESHLGGDTVVHHLMHGYAFATNNLPPARYKKLADTRYVESVLFVPGTKRFAAVPQAEIDRMRGLLSELVDQGIAIGDTVVITAGPYKHIQAVVVEEIPEEDAVQCYIRLRSKQSLVTLPRGVLRVVDQTPYSKYYVRISRLLQWAEKALLIKGLALPDGQYLRDQASYLTTITDLLCRLSKQESLHRVLTNYWPQLLATKQAELEKRANWLVQGSRLFAVVSSMSGALEASSRQLSVKAQSAMDLADLLEQVDAITNDIDALDRSLSREDRGEVFEHLVVDGHNLAFRCLYAPGMSDLKAADGRPTGVVYGVLKNLIHLKKRFSSAKIWVSWDGSSRRRKALYDQYKANRNHAQVTQDGVAWDQVSYVKDCLRALGVTQVWNPEEEADDVIGSLVQGPLADACTLIYSSDRDMCQLVTDKTHLLHPAVGARRELFVIGDEGVKDMFGVPAHLVATLKALMGDPSDNIPGAPRVPKRILAALVNQYGSVDGVYKSGLSGLTKNQYERLRAFEPQARLNLKLTEMVSVQYFTDTAPFDANLATDLLSGLAIEAQAIVSSFG